MIRILRIQLPRPLAEAVEASRPHLIAAAAFSLFVNLLFLAPAIYMLQVYDRVVATGGKSTLIYITLALAIALLALAGLDGIRSRLLVRASARLDSILSAQILRRMIGRGGRDQGQAMRDFDTVRQALSSPAAAGVFDAPFAPIFITVCFLLHFWIGVLAVASVALLFALAWRNQGKTRREIEIGTRALAMAQASDQAAAMHAQAVRALGMSEGLARRHLAQRALGVGKLADAQFAGARYTAVSKFIRLFVQSAALGLGALLAIAGEISAGGIIAGSILLGRALQPVDALIGGWTTLSGALAAWERLIETFRAPSEADRIRTALPAPEGRVEAEQIGVRGAGGGAILYGVSLKVEPGELLGIVGPSGSGKTTLAKVVAGAIEPDAGVVRIDGAKRSDWDPERLGRHIGYLPQDPSLFEGTIKDNISRFDSWSGGNPETTDAAVIAAARLAGVHDVILSLPQGYDTPLGPLGEGLSAGQAQRIALARALYGDPSVLILDEPNAFLDPQGEAALLRAVAAARARKAAVLMIAHRRAVLGNADRLLVLEGGRAKMAGPAKDVVRIAGQDGESAA